MFNREQRWGWLTKTVLIFVVCWIPASVMLSSIDAPPLFSLLVGWALGAGSMVLASLWEER